MKIRFSDDAKEDVQDIADCMFETSGEEYEAAYLKSLNQQLEEIAKDPERWRKRKDLLAGCQTALTGQHLIFFGVQKDAVFVSRVLHQSLDVPRRVFPTQEG